jgi:hypothetical protein
VLTGFSGQKMSGSSSFIFYLSTSGFPETLRRRLFCLLLGHNTPFFQFKKSLDFRLNAGKLYETPAAVQYFYEEIQDTQKIKTETPQGCHTNKKSVYQL